MLLDLQFWWNSGGTGTVPSGPPLVHDVAVWLGGYDITGAVNQVALAAARAEIPHMRLSDDIATSFPGDEIVSAMIGGAWTAGSGSIDAIIASRLIGSGADFSEWPLTILPPVAPGDAGTDGNAAYNLRSAQLAMGLGGQHGQLMPFALMSRALTGRLDRATVMLPKATRTASVNGTVYTLGAVTASTKLLCILHGFGVTAGAVSVAIQSGSGFTQRALFNTLTGIGRQVLEVTTISAEDTWRISTSFSGGDYTIACLAALVAR